MKKILFILSLLAIAGTASAQFPSKDSAERFINKWIRNSAIDAFTNLRLNQALIYTLRYADSANILSVTAINDSTLRLITKGKDTFDVVLPGGGSAITASNGATKTGNNIKLGGPLVNNTDIASAGFNLNLSGTGKFQVGSTGSSTAVMQANSGTAFSSTPYLALGPLLANTIYSTLHTSDTVTTATEAAVPLRGYQMNRNLVMGANGNVTLTGKNGSAWANILRARDTVTMNASGHNNWYANSSQLSFLKAGGYTGRSSIRGGVDGISDAPNALTAELVIGGSSGANNFHFYGDWVSFVAELAHTASSQDTMDHYMSVWANANYAGKILKAEYFRGFGLGTQTDSLWSIYFDETNARGYHEGNFGIGTRVPLAKLHLSAGTTTIAPIALTLGTDMASPVAGRLSYATISGIDRLAFVPTGTTYKRFAFTNDVAPSNGQIPIGNGTDYTVAPLTGSASITVTNGAGSIGLEVPTSYLQAADYVPTLTGIANVDAVTLIDAHYMRINDQVSFDVMLTIDPTAATTTTNVDVTLPIAATITNFTNLTGIITSGDGAIGNIVAAGNKARLGFISTSTSSTTYNIHVSYKIP